MRQLKVTQSITNRDSLSLNKYLAEVSKIALLTPAEETRLAGQIRIGNEAAAQQLVKANLRFVVSVAKQYQHRGFPLIDLINEGNVGLIRATQHFDETKGFKFISYAVWWIRQSIIVAINDKSRIVRLPSSKAQLYNRAALASSALAQSLDREPDNSELAALLGVAEKELELMQSSQYHLSLDAPLDEEGSSTLLNQLLAADSSAADWKTKGRSLHMELNRCLQTLPHLQQKIMYMHYGIGRTDSMSLRTIAAELHLTEERIRQLKQKALQQLCTGKKGQLLQAYLG